MRAKRVFLLFTLFSIQSFAGRSHPLNSTPPEISNLVLCSDETVDDHLKLEREDFCKLTNSIREWHLVTTLRMDSELNRLAQQKVEALETETEFSSPNSKVATDDVDTSDLDETTQVSIGRFDPAHQVLSETLNIPAERKKFLSHSFHKVGVGFYHGIWLSLFSE